MTFNVRPRDFLVFYWLLILLVIYRDGLIKIDPNSTDYEHVISFGAGSS